MIAHRGYARFDARNAAYMFNSQYRSRTIRMSMTVDKNKNSIDFTGHYGKAFVIKKIEFVKAPTQRTLLLCDMINCIKNRVIEQKMEFLPGNDDPITVVMPFVIEEMPELYIAGDQNCELKITGEFVDRELYYPVEQ